MTLGFAAGADSHGRRTLGLLETATLVFVVLKLAGLIDWSWWLVLTPLWVAAALWITLAVAFFKAFSWMDRL